MLVDKFIYSIYDAAVEGLKQGKELQPHVFALYAPEVKPDGKIDYPAVGYPMLFADQEEKDALLKKIGFDMAGVPKELVCNLFIGEAWAVSHTGQEYEEALRKDGFVMPSVDPNRFEVLVITAMLADRQRKILTFKIEQDPITKSRSVTPCEVEKEIPNTWMSVGDVVNNRYEDTMLVNIWKDYSLAKMFQQTEKGA